MSDNYPIVYNKDHYIVMANDIIRGKQEMSLQEARIIRLLVTQVVKEDKDLKTYNMRIIDLAHHLGISESNIYRDIYKICDSLLRRIISIGTGNPKEPWNKFHWLQLAKYDGNGTITLMLSEQIKPFVIGLNEYFTQYKQANILDMTSIYALRLYEILKSDDYKPGDYRKYPIEFLREAFGCENKLIKISQFKEKAINTAVREINEKTDIRIGNVNYEKKGRSIAFVEFEMHYNIDTAIRQNQLAGQLSFDGNEVKD